MNSNLNRGNDKGDGGREMDSDEMSHHKRKMKTFMPNTECENFYAHFIDFTHISGMNYYASGPSICENYIFFIRRLESKSFEI